MNLPQTKLACALLAATVFAGPALGYQKATHGAIADAATDVTALAADGYRHLGLHFDPASVRQVFPSPSGGASLSIRGLIRAGAEGEDAPEIRGRHHFYDVRNGGAGLTWSSGLVIGEPSPVWALGTPGTWAADCNALFGLLQCYDYGIIRGYYHLALTTPNEFARANYYGKTFEGLGHLIHHMGDMAQPQHVRNDNHTEYGPLELLLPSPCNDPLNGTCVLASLYRSIRNPSLYERSTNQFFAGANPIPGGARLLEGYPPVHSAADPFTFDTPLKFWSNGDNDGSPKGIAQFTALNFPSAGTIGSTPPVVDRANFADFDVQALCSNAVPACPAGLSGSMRMYAMPVSDRYRPETGGTNPRGLTESIFDADLHQVPGGRMILALNRFNYDAQRERLLPRAVGFSAGLINYFFRGRMEVTLPDDGVYGIADHNDPAVAIPANRGGFAKIRLKVRNVTPGAGAGGAVVEPIDDAGISTGRLWAVARYHQNLCYTPDLSGEYGAIANGMTRIGANPACRDGADRLTVSLPVAVPPGINEAPQTVTFDFGSFPVPIDATDLYLQVIYRGPLGLEPDAVVVATRDISEPTYLTAYSRWDQFRYACPWPQVESPVSGVPALCINGGAVPGGYSYAEWCATGGYADLAECNRGMGLTYKYQFLPAATAVPGYDPAANPAVPQGAWADLSRQPPFSPLVVMPAPVGSLARVAVLTDAAPANNGLLVIEWVDPRHGTNIFQWLTGRAIATTAQADPDTGAVTTSVTYAPARGAWVASGDAVLLNQGTDHPDLAPARSTVNF